MGVFRLSRTKQLWLSFPCVALLYCNNFFSSLNLYFLNHTALDKILTPIIVPVKIIVTIARKFFSFRILSSKHFYLNSIPEQGIIIASLPNL